MVNTIGRVKKYKDKEWYNTSFYISEAFKRDWETFCKIIPIDDNKDFIEYCKYIEDVDVYKLGKGRKGIYIRWVISTHVKNNRHLLRKN